MSKTPLQTIIDPGSDPTLNVYATNAQTVPVISSANVVITNTNQYITEVYNLKAAAAGNIGEIEFNDGSGLAADTGLTYDAASDSLHVSGNVFTGNLRTDHLLYANGSAFVFPSTYGNGNVASYLPTYSGVLTAGTIVSTGNSNASTFYGSGAGLTNLPAGNISGTVLNSNHATVADLANSVSGSNVSGTVSNATHATVSDSANSVAGGNVSGTVSSASSATTATTVTANSQPNITTVGTLTSVTVSGNLSVANIAANGTANIAHINVSTTANLGAVGNVTITGGSNGQSLTTDGSGHLSWSTLTPSSTPTLQQVTEQSGITDQPVNITNSTVSTGFSSGALRVDGGVGVHGDIFVGGHIAAHDAVYAGQYASYSSFTLPKFIGRDAGASYIQGALVNTNGNGSADWVAYGDQSLDTEGWMDFGFTGSTFNDPNYTITKANDGYLFAQGLTGVGGNLVIATGELGGATHRDIVFATGGFSLADERMRLNHEDSTFYIGQHGDGMGGLTHLDVNGNAMFRSNVKVVASHANLVFGDASATGNPGTSSTGTYSIVTNKGVSEKQWIFNTDGNVSIPGSIVFTDDSVQSSAPRDEPSFGLKWSTFTVEVGKRYMVDTVGGVASTTLPASPTQGDAIFFVDAYGSFASNSLVIHPNGKTVMNASGDYTVSTANLSFGLVYNGAGDWRVY